MDYYSNGTIDSVVFEGNSSSYGGGLEVTNSTVSMSDSDVSANIGGAIYGFVSSTLTVSDTDFADNTATYQGNIYLDNLVSSTFTGCTFTDNAGGTAGVFSFSRTSSANFLSTDFSGNTPYDAWAAGTGYTFGSSAAGNCSDSTGCI
jgi:predicted outer membrane repeat protein